MTFLVDENVKLTYGDFTVVVGELVQLFKFVVTDFDLLELLSLRKHGQNVGLIHHRFHLLVEDLGGRKNVK